jgi:hypothetical protein
MALAQLDRAEEALATYDEVDRRFGDSADLGVQSQVARALLGKATVLSHLRRVAEAVETYDAIDRRFGGEACAVEIDPNADIEPGAASEPTDDFERGVTAAVALEMEFEASGGVSPGRGRLSRRHVNALLEAAAARDAETRADAQAEYDRLIDAMSPPEVPTSARVTQARWNAVARERFLREHGAVPATEVGELAGYDTSTNPSMPASRWQAEGKAFSVVRGGRQLFPVFQFGDDGRPLPAMAPILRSFGERSSGWQVALWFDAPNAHLDGARPIDLLADRPEDVARAAAYAIGMPDF